MSERKPCITVDMDKVLTDRMGRKLLFTSPHNMLLTEHERVGTWKDMAEKLL